MGVHELHPSLECGDEREGHSAVPIFSRPSNWPDMNVGKGDSGVDESPFFQQLRRWPPKWLRAFWCSDRTSPLSRHRLLAFRAKCRAGLRQIASDHMLHVVGSLSSVVSCVLSDTKSVVGQFGTEGHVDRVARNRRCYYFAPNGKSVAT